MRALLTIILFGGASDYRVKPFVEPEVGDDTSPPPIEEESELFLTARRMPRENMGRNRSRH